MLESKGVIEPVGNGTFVVVRAAQPAQPLARAAALARRGQPERALRAAPDARGRGRRTRRRAALGRRPRDMATAIEEMARGPRRPGDVRGRRRALPRRRGGGDRQPRRPARDARDPRPAGARARAGLRDPRQRGPLARAASRRSSPRSRPARPRRRAAACARTSRASSARSTMRSPRAGSPTSARRRHARRDGVARWRRSATLDSASWAEGWPAACSRPATR